MARFVSPLLGPCVVPRFEVVFDPHGRLVPTAPARPMTTGMNDLYRLNAPLAITPACNTPLWDGERIHYGWMIDDLVRADQFA